jgi:CxxC motif-containing protein (DUF1111 family)
MRTGSLFDRKFIPASEGGIHHRNGESALNSTANRIASERVSPNLLGDGLIEAINGSDIEQNAQQQRQGKLGIAGAFVSTPALEADATSTKMQVGRFGWKSQHSRGLGQVRFSA